jgi:V/A-type H+/Na+-transporting ATPase subunit E
MPGSSSGSSTGCTRVEVGLAMAPDLEGFVAKLHADGVAAGRAEAERLVEAARVEAAELRRQAAEGAEAILAAADVEARRVAERTRAELRLAARDTLLSLRAALTRALEAVVRRALEPPLRDPAVLETLLAHLVTEYARADAAGVRRIEIRVEGPLAERVRTATLQELARGLSGGKVDVDVEGILTEAGFVYRVDGAHVDMTLASVADVVRDVVRPGLQHMLDAVALEPPTAAAPAGTG